MRLLSLATDDSSSDTNVFLGADGQQVVKPMLLVDGRMEAAKYNHVLIYLDEVPALSDTNTDSFYECLFLRNLIRCLRLPCLLSGTESTLMDAQDEKIGSRHAGSDPWVWLLTKFLTLTASLQ